MNKQMSIRLASAGLLASAILAFTACKKQEPGIASHDTPNLTETYDYLNIQEGGVSKPLEQVIRDQSKENLSNFSVKLGRVLFYDKKLSINNTVSCATCHIQSLAFADNKSFSTGFGGRSTKRNSMAIQNPVNNNNMFWDSRASSPLELSLMPVFDHLEMGIESDEMLENKLKNTSYYPDLFYNAFGSTEITRAKISLAMTQFVNALFSKESAFDKGQQNNFANFNPLEKYGKDLFFSERLMCSQCHAGSNFSAPDEPGGAYGGSGFGGDDPKGTANIGLDISYLDNGKGSGKFKIPSLRNIELTAPYMHDGRFKTLEEVLNHYSHGIKDHPALDGKFRANGQPKKLNLDDNEKQALMAFLRTLTDKNLISNKKFSDPFKY